MHWFEHVDNVTQLGAALVTAGFDAGQLQGYYERPHRWTHEWAALQRGGQAALEKFLGGDTSGDDESFRIRGM